MRHRNCCLANRAARTDALVDRNTDGRGWTARGWPCGDGWQFREWGAGNVLGGLILDLGRKSADRVEIAHGVVDLFPGIGNRSGDDEQQQRDDPNRPAVVPTYALFSPATADLFGLLARWQLEGFRLRGLTGQQGGSTSLAELVPRSNGGTANGTAEGRLLRGQDVTPRTGCAERSNGRAPGIVRHPSAAKRLGAGGRQHSHIAAAPRGGKRQIQLFRWRESRVRRDRRHILHGIGRQHIRIRAGRWHIARLGAADATGRPHRPCRPDSRARRPLRRQPRIRFFHQPL